MSSWLRKGRSKRLVLDLGTSAIRLCELSPTKTGYQLTKYYQRELNIDPAMEEDEKLQRKQAVLDELLKEAKVRTKKTITAVPGQSVFTRNRPLPPVPEYKVTQIVRYEIQQQIPFSLDQIALDYQVLDRTEAGGYDVMMAAIKVDVVERLLEALEGTKRSIETVDVSPLAAYNWLKHTGEFGEEGECVALLDMGATTTDIVVQKDNRFRFTRSLNVGGNDVTKGIASAFNVSFEEAEKLKRERGFAPTGNPQRDGKGGEVIGQVLSRLVGEINRSLAYFRSQPGGGPTQRVIVTGGGACLRNIIPYLQRQLGIEVRIAQPLAGLAIAPGANEASEHPEQSCVALGLALRCCQTVPIQINLIPPRVLETARRREQAVYWILSLTTLFLIMASIIPVTAAKDERTQERIKILKQALATYDPSLIENPTQRSDFEDDYMFIKDEVTGLREEVQMLESIREDRHFWLEYLKAVNNARPKEGGITLSSIETAVIGGPGNTGDRVKNKGDAKTQQAGGGGNQQGGGGSADNPFASAGGGGGGGGAGGGGGGLSAAVGGGGGGLSAAVGGGGLSAGIPRRGGGGANLKEYNAKGFAGIAPPFVPAAGPRGRGGGGGVSAIVEPNGLVIYGYAEDKDTLIRYVESLKEREEFIDGGVYFHVSQADEVGETTLDNAKIGGGGEVGGSDDRGQGSDSDESALSRAMSQGLAGAGSGGGGGGGRQISPWERRLMQFRIDVQFLGSPLPPPDEKPDENNRGR